MSQFDEVLEEIKALPVGDEISDRSARLIAGWYNTGASTEVAMFVATGTVQSRDLFQQITNEGENYKGAAADERLILDHLAMYLLSRGGIQEGELESLWVDA